MAKTKEILTQSILELLLKEPHGLEVAQIITRLGGDDFVSPRGVRNLLKELVKEEKLIKFKRQAPGRGTPPYAYFHPDTLPKQLNIFETIPGVSSKSHLISRTEIEKKELDPQELESQKKARSVLSRIAASHLQEETYAKAVIEIAPQLADENPIDLLISMAQWVVDDINRKGEQIQRKFDRGEFEVAKQMAGKMDSQLGWARRYFQLFWRLDRSIGDIPGCLDLPLQFKHFNQGKRACLNENKAREVLNKRIFGDKVVESWSKKIKSHKGVAGTDASVADIFLAHSPGSFIPPHPVVVTTSASALITRFENSIQEYQDFDISPDRLQDYDDYQAARYGLVLAPELMQSIGTDRFKHSRMAAMELRQYTAELHIPTGDARWRPLGDAPELGIKPKPTLIIRDGRVFPLVHRLGDFEDDTLYGQIVRNQIEQFVKVNHNTISNPIGEVVYGAAVKSPQMSWLAPLVFWYLHIHKKVDGIVVEADEVYKSPFADTAVSHLLFLGVAKRSRHFAQDRLFTTCRVLRRFSDIALVDSSLPVVLDTEQGQPRLINENSREDWEEFITQHLDNKRRRYQESILNETEYNSFLYLCSKIGVFMCYTAPTSAYEPIVSDEHGGGGHFLIPRVEIAINLERSPDSYHKSLDKMLSWLADGNWVLDYGHTQSGFDTGDQQNRLPILVPNVTFLAHEAATFARNKLGEEVQDEIRALIAELRRRTEKGRSQSG